MVTQIEGSPGGQAAQGQHTEPGRVLRIVALAAMVAGLAALTAAACVLSYHPIHHLAIHAGVSPRLATIYPVIFDALLVLAGCSVLALRGAGVISRIYAWLCLLVLLAGLASGGAVHAANIRFSRKLGGVVAAIVPWVLVLIGFGLLLALLRYARLRRQAARATYTELPAHPLKHEPDAVAIDRSAVPAPGPVPGADPAGRARTARAISSRAAGSGQAASSGLTPHSPSTDLTKSGQHKLPVRQANLQFRARVPRPAPASGRPPSTAAGAMQAGNPPRGPFMPPVGTHQPPPPAERSAAAAQRPAHASQTPADPKATPSQEQAAAAKPSGGVGKSTATDPSTGQAGRTDSGPADASSAEVPQAPAPASGTAAAADAKSPAPTETDEKQTQGEPPSFQRQRSSPTRPDEE